MTNPSASGRPTLPERAALLTVIAAAAAAIAFVIFAPGGFEPEDDDGLPASPLPPGVHLSAAPVPASAPLATAPAVAAPAVPIPVLDLDLAVTAREHEAAARLASRLARLARDLEFTPGLREPPQSITREPPEPWHPDPLASEDARPVIREVAPRTAGAGGGTVVTIRGSNLRASQVMFGGAAARIVRATPEDITVLAPRAAAGPVSIVVTNDDGTYAIAGEAFTYVQWTSANGQ